jgi:hypothetical protein
VSWGPDRLDVFARGANDAMWHLWWHGGWGEWEDLGGVLQSDPAVASWGENRLDCFVQGTNHALHHKAWDGRWHDWNDLGGVLASGYPPAAVSRTEGIIDVFVNAANPPNHVAQKSWAGDHWTEWTGHGVPVASGPTAASWGPDRVDLFAQAQNGGLLHKTFDSGWGTWKGVPGGDFRFAPAAVSLKSGHIDVYVCDTNGELSHRWFQREGTLVD